MRQRERAERDENPSPTHIASVRSQQSQPRGTHQRRDSDTLRIASAVQAARREQEQQQYYQDQYVEQEQAQAPQRFHQNPSPTARNGGTVTLVNSQPSSISQRVRIQAGFIICHHHHQQLRYTNLAF